MAGLRRPGAQRDEARAARACLLSQTRQSLHPAQNPSSSRRLSAGGNAEAAVEIRGLCPNRGDASQMQPAT